MTRRQKYFRWLLLIASGLACLLVFYPFIMEILSAAFFAFALFPMTTYLSSHKYFGRKGWVVVTLMGLILVITLPIILITVSFINLVQDFTSQGFQSSDLYRDLSQAKDVVATFVSQMLVTFNLERSFDLYAITNQFFSNAGGKIVALSGALATGFPNFVLSMFIFCCSLYLFLTEGRKIRFLLTHNQLIPSYELDRLIPIFQKSCYTTLVASVAVGAIQALTVATGAVILGSPYFLLIFLVTFVLSFIPVVGAAPVAFFLAFLAIIKGHAAYAVGYVVLGIVAGTMDNVIRPYLVKGEGNVHSVIMLIAIIGAIIFFGLPGLFLGPMFVSVAAEIYSLYIFEDLEAGDPDSLIVEAKS
jgi:predicted PurR-regulated permease PerM